MTARNPRQRGGQTRSICFRPSNIQQRKLGELQAVASHVLPEYRPPLRPFRRAPAATSRLLCTSRGRSADGSRTDPAQADVARRVGHVVVKRVRTASTRLEASRSRGGSRRPTPPLVFVTAVVSEWVGGRRRRRHRRGRGVAELRRQVHLVRAAAVLRMQAQLLVLIFVVAVGLVADARVPGLVRVQRPAPAAAAACPPATTRRDAGRALVGAGRGARVAPAAERAQLVVDPARHPAAAAAARRRVLRAVVQGRLGFAEGVEGCDGRWRELCKEEDEWRRQLSSHTPRAMCDSPATRNMELWNLHPVFARASGRRAASLPRRLLQALPER